MGTPPRLDIREIVARAREALPDLTLDASAPVERSIKCAIVPATIHGRPVVIKALIRDDRVWRTFLHHEREVHAVLPAALAGVRIPRLLGAAADVLIFERASGPPLSRRRHGTLDAVSMPTWERLIAFSAALAAVPTPHFARPDVTVQTSLSRRMLEDPWDPEWMVRGVALLGRRGLLSKSDAESVSRALGDATTSFCHGDLLPRNVLSAPGGELAVVDWECAGAHPTGWDAALLYAFAPEWVRARLLTLGADTPRMLALAAFAVARELFYRRASEGSSTVRLSNLLTRTLADLRAGVWASTSGRVRA